MMSVRATTSVYSVLQAVLACPVTTCWSSVLPMSTPDSYCCFGSTTAKTEAEAVPAKCSPRDLPQVDADPVHVPFWSSMQSMMSNISHSLNKRVSAGVNILAEQPDTTPATSGHSLASSQLLLSELLRVFATRVPGGILPDEAVSSFMKQYKDAQGSEARQAFFLLMHEKLGVQINMVEAAIAQYNKALERCVSGVSASDATVLRALQKLHNASLPMYTQLFLSISQKHNGLKFLVDLRADLLALLKAQPSAAQNAPLKMLSEHLRLCLAEWFSVGLMEVRRVSWQNSPAELLEKVMRAEAVHPIPSWQEMQQRLGPLRRVFAFFHPSMPREPLVVLHCALLDEVTGCMADILQQEQSQSSWGRSVQAAGPNAAVFYSISATQPGLAGIDLGQFLIKEVAELVQKEFPTIQQLATLSPLPKFRTWLMAHLAAAAVAKQSTRPMTSRSAGQAGSTPGGLHDPEAQNMTHSMPVQCKQASKSDAGRPNQSLEPSGSSEQPTLNPSQDNHVSSTSPPNASGHASHATAQTSPQESRTQTHSSTSRRDGHAALSETHMASGQHAAAAEGSCAQHSTPQPCRPASSDSAVAASDLLLPAECKRLQMLRDDLAARGQSAPELERASPLQVLMYLLQDDRWLQFPEHEQSMQRLLLRLAAHYLAVERRRGLALDPVAHFHLRNGASLWRLNWKADMSVLGLQRSFGIMVNYMYDLDNVHSNNRRYLVDRKPVISESVAKLVEGDFSLLDNLAIIKKQHLQAMTNQAKQHNHAQ